MRVLCNYVRKKPGLYRKSHQLGFHSLHPFLCLTIYSNPILVGGLASTFRLFSNSDKIVGVFGTENMDKVNVLGYVAGSL